MVAYETCGGKLRGPMRGEPREDGRTTCTRPAGWGTAHPGIGKCKLHGGSTRNHAKFAEVEKAKREVELWGGRKDIHPAEALLELVQQKAAEVEYWRYRVAALPEEDLTYGDTKHESGVDKGQPVDILTAESKPHIALVQLHKAEADLAAYSAASLKAGVDEQKIRISQVHAVQMLELLRSALTDPRLGIGAGAPVDAVIFDAVKEIGHG